MNSLAAQLTMARYLARKAIKTELQANGVKLAYIEPADISRAATAYLAANMTELLERTKLYLK